MTSIRPPIEIPVAPGLSRDPAAPRSGAPDGDLDFAAMLARAGGDLPAGPPVTETPPNVGNKFPTAVAHVFNAFGFFSADEAEQGQGTPAPTEAGFPDAPLPDEQSRLQGGPNSEGAIRPELCDDSRSMFHSSPGARAVQIDQPSAAQSRLAKEGARPSAPSDQFYRAVQNRLANEPELPEPSRASPSRNEAKVAEQRDRITFKIAEHSVELIGRLQNLSEEEKQRLFDELDQLLEAHGLSLAAATLNGVSFSRNVLGGMQ